MLLSQLPDLPSVQYSCGVYYICSTAAAASSSQTLGCSELGSNQSKGLVGVGSRKQCHSCCKCLPSGSCFVLLSCCKLAACVLECCCASCVRCCTSGPNHLMLGYNKVRYLALTVGYVGACTWVMPTALPVLLVASMRQFSAWTAGLSRFVQRCVDSPMVGTGS